MSEHLYLLITLKAGGAFGGGLTADQDRVLRAAFPLAGNTLVIPEWQAGDKTNARLQITTSADRKSVLLEGVFVSAPTVEEIVAKTAQQLTLIIKAEAAKAKVTQAAMLNALLPGATFATLPAIIGAGIEVVVFSGENKRISAALARAYVRGQAGWQVAK